MRTDLVSAKTMPADQQQQASISASVHDFKLNITAAAFAPKSEAADLGEQILLARDLPCEVSVRPCFVQQLIIPVCGTAERCDATGSFLTGAGDLASKCSRVSLFDCLVARFHEVIPCFYCSWRLAYQKNRLESRVKPNWALVV